MIVAVSENFVHIGKLDHHADIFTQCLEIPGYNFFGTKPEQNQIYQKAVATVCLLLVKQAKRSA